MTPAYLNEIRQRIGSADYESIRPRLLRIMHKNPNANADGRQHVRSLYFDSSYEQALRMKFDDVQPRKQFRIRLYNLSDRQIALEKKSKLYGSMQKQAVRLTRAECGRILDGDIDWLAQTRNPLLLEFYAAHRRQALEPRTIVDYWRETLVYPYGNVVVTFDRNIRSGPYGGSLFQQMLPQAPTLTAQPILMEVKYDDFLPEGIARIVGDGWNPPGVAWAPYAVGSVL